jgi:hypothetical protein
MGLDVADNIKKMTVAAGKVRRPRLGRKRLGNRPGRANLAGA